MDLIDRKQRYLDKLHKDILTIMDEIDRICREYQLRYYLMCGSCLGAVRHKGFIPWDDDLDVTMPREDYDKFISLVSDKTEVKHILGKRFYLRWVTTDKYYNQDFAKICLKGTVFQANNGRSEDNAGIYVDIFPLEPCGHYSERVERISQLYNHFHSCLYLIGAEKDAMDWRIKHWPRNLIVKLLSNRSIYKIMLCIIKLEKKDNYEYQAYFSTPYPIRRQLFPKSWHGQGKLMQFEDRYYMCPDEPEKMMEFIYGDEYMELPPENKRKTHCPIRVVFSDGEEMCFEKPLLSIKYEDLLS